MWITFFLGLVVCVPLALGGGKHYVGDKYLAEACRLAAEEVDYSFQETRTQFRPHESPFGSYFGSKEGSKKSKWKKSKKSKKSSDNLLQKLRFPSLGAQRLARSEEIKEMALEKLFSILRERKEIKDEDDVTENTCDVDKKNRVDCGFPGITRWDCRNKKSCCFDDSKKAKITCFHRKEHSLFRILSPNARQMLSKTVGCEDVREPADCSDWCYHSKYRSIDGTCNNLENPLWGASLTPLRRVLPAAYENSFSTPTGWTRGRRYNGFELPLARKVSTSVLSCDEVVEDDDFSYMVMQWGQFIDHDTDITPTNPSGAGFKSGIPCGQNDQNELPCFPILIPEDDHRIKNKTALGFTRSAAICTGGSFGARQQMNEITSYMDSTNVYGSTKYDNEALRDKEDRAYLAHGYEMSPGKYLLPLDEEGEFSGCEVDPDVDEPCFRAGDKRANEQLGLTMIHTIFHREHNHIVDELKIVNPQWDAERYYQEARKILNAQYQHISFSHWLPKIIGTEGMKQLGDYAGYDPTVDASVSNNFATATYRFGHAQILHIVPRLNAAYQESEWGHLPLHKGFFAPQLIKQEGGLDDIIRGWIGTACKMTSTSNILNVELVEKLFSLAKAVALDLGALNVQRGRDHGLPSYTAFRDYCGLPQVTSWKDLSREIRSYDVLGRLRNTYGHPDNIDLFVGGLCEDNLPGSRIGPTFTCLVGEQFRRLRDGDRFFYRRDGYFTDAQLAEIEKSTLSRIFCDNCDGTITEIPPDVFQKVDYPAGFVPCEQIPSIDYSAWAETDDALGVCPNSPSVAQPDADPSVDQLCCCDKVYGSAENPINLAVMRCCGNVAYNPTIDSCCNTKINCGKPEGTYVCCGETAFDPWGASCVDGVITSTGSSVPLCDDRPYDPRWKICCAGSRQKREDETTTCCGKKAYNPLNAICCRGVVSKVSSPFEQCCGPYSYDSRFEVCCQPGDVQDRPDSRSGGAGGSSSKSGSGSRDYYDPHDRYYGSGSREKRSADSNPYWNAPPTGTICCGVTIENRPFTSSDSCCGGNPYNWSQELCCNGNLVDGHPKTHRCCSVASYRPDEESCCDTGRGLRVFDGVGSCPLGETHSCRGLPYDPANYVCCEGNLYPGGPYVGCCGREAYNVNDQVCCPNDECRDKAYYKSEPQACSIH